MIVITVSCSDKITVLDGKHDKQDCEKTGAVTSILEKQLTVVYNLSLQLHNVAVISGVSRAIIRSFITIRIRNYFVLATQKQL